MRCKDTEYFGKNRNLSKLMFIGQNKKGNMHSIEIISWTTE